MKRDDLLELLRRYKDVALVILAVLIVILVLTANPARPDL